MTTALALIAATFLVGTLVGHAVHWVMHQRWSGRLYDAHMNHHLKQYPPKNLFSIGVYRSSGLDSGWLTFTPPIALFVVLFVVAMRAYGLPLYMQAIVTVEFAVLGFLHGYVHDALHIRGHWMERLWGFHHLRRAHIIHHLAMKRNLGIFWFGWDRVFGSYRYFNPSHPGAHEGKRRMRRKRR